MLAHEDEQAGRPFVMKDVMDRIWAAGVIPIALIEAQMVSAPASPGTTTRE